METKDMLCKQIFQAYRYAQSYVGEGELVAYIPELAATVPTALGVCLALPDGEIFSHGQAETLFTMQSISKVLTLMFTLERYGYDAVFHKVGMEPTGDPFNSLTKLETVSEKPFNPMINAGAIVTASFIQEHGAYNEMMGFISELVGNHALSVCDAAYHSERSHGTRNRALAYLLSSKGVITSDVDESLDIYFRLCSLGITATQLARLGLILAMSGVDPQSGRTLVTPWVTQITKTLMLTCGMYDSSGEFAVRVGIPSKSGVGGGILSCVERRCGIGIFGPALDKKGNSVGGVKLLEHLSHSAKMHLFSIAQQTSIEKGKSLQIVR